MNRLYRSVHNRRITGLCGGLADRFGIDASLIRFTLAVATFFTGGTLILLYLLCSWVVPSEYRTHM